MLFKSDHSIKLKKLIEIRDTLVDSLNYLYFNDISLKTYFSNENPITPKPLCSLSNLL